MFQSLKGPHSVKKQKDCAQCQEDMPEHIGLFVKSHWDDVIICELDQLTAQRKNTMQLRENPLV